MITQEQTDLVVHELVPLLSASDKRLTVIEKTALRAALQIAQQQLATAELTAEALTMLTRVQKGKDDDNKEG